MTTLPMQANYNGQSLDIIIIGNQRWLRGGQIGHSLGFADPVRSMSRLFKRNKDEFGLDDAMVIELQSSGGSQLTRIFSDKGVAKIAMLAKTPKAAAFRDWAAKTLTTPQEPTEPPVLELHSGFSPRVNRELSRAWLSKPQNRKFVKYAHLPIARADMALMCGWKASSTVSLKRRVAETLGLIAPDASLMPSSFQRHVALQRAASSNMAIANHGAHHG